MKKIIYAISILSGTTIGVGFFVLPYIASKVGIWLILSYFFILGGIVIITHLLFGEVAIKTPDFLRLPGYAKIYLGKWGERTAFFSTIFGFLGAILAYLIVGGQFLTALLKPVLGGSDLFYTLFYFISGAILIYFGIKTIAKVELFGLFFFFIILAVIFFRGLPFFKIENFFPSTNWQMNFDFLFLPYGPILFSLWGAALIPEIEEMLGGQKHLLKKIIPIAIIIPIIAYLIFIFVVLGISGQNTSKEAIIGLGNLLGGNVVKLALIFGVLTTFTSFIALGLTLKKVFWYDLKIPKDIAWALTCLVPIFLFFKGFTNFIEVIGLVGGVMLGINGILMILMYQVVKRTPRFSLTFLLTSSLMLIFLLGIVYEIYYFVIR